MTATPAQDVRALCDRLEQAHAAATTLPMLDDDDAWRRLEQARYEAIKAVPALVSAVRAVADLADELDKFGTDRDRDNADDDESQAASAAAYLRSAIRLRSALAAALSPTEVRP